MEFGSKSKDTGHVRWASLWAACIILLALALRLYRLGAESLWIDEGFSLRDASGLKFLGGTRPLYFLFLHAWLKVVPHSEFFLRLPSAIFGTGAVWALYAVGRRLMGTRTALLASAFMAISVLLINHSREIRMYSLVVLLAVLATNLLLVYLDRGRTGHLLGYAIVSLAGLLTQALSVLILVAHGIFLLLYARAYRPRSYALVGALILVALMWVPWMLNNTRASAGYSEGYTSILDKPTLRGFIEFTGKFFLWKWSDPGRVLAMGAFGLSLLVFAVALFGLREFRRSDAGVALALTWMLVPMLGVVVFSYTLANMWMVHYLIAASPAFFLLVAKGIGSIGNRYAATLVAVVVATLTLGRLWMYLTKNMHPEWERAISYIEAHERPGDVIGIYYSGNQHVFHYYYRGRSRWAPLGGEEITREHFAGWNDERASELLAGFPLSGRRLWLALSNHMYAGGPAIIEHVTKRYCVLEHRYYSQLELFLLDAGGRPVPNEPGFAKGTQPAASAAKALRTTGTLSDQGASRAHK